VKLIVSGFPGFGLFYCYNCYIFLLFWGAGAFYRVCIKEKLIGNKTGFVIAQPYFIVAAIVRDKPAPVQKANTTEQQL